MKISLNCPTRGRPSNMIRMWESAYSCANQKDKLEIFFYVDHDDAPSYGTAQFLAEQYPKNVKYKLGPRVGASMMHQTIWKETEADIVKLSGDDILFSTNGWDDMVREVFSRFPDRIALVYFDDGNWGERFSTHPFLSKEWCHTLGYVVPPYFSRDFCDTWNFELAQRIGRAVYLPYKEQHLHVSFGTAEMDETYRENFEITRRDNNGALYHSLAGKRDEDVQKLLKAINAAG